MVVRDIKLAAQSLAVRFAPKAALRLIFAPCEPGDVIQIPRPIRFVSGVLLFFLLGGGAQVLLSGVLDVYLGTFAGSVFVLVFLAIALGLSYYVEYVRGERKTAHTN